MTAVGHLEADLAIEITVFAQHLELKRCSHHVVRLSEWLPGCWKPTRFRAQGGDCLTSHGVLRDDLEQWPSGAPSMIPNY